MATTSSRLYTFDEYLDLEEAAEYKNEFRNGEIHAMSGGTFIHSALSVRMITLLDRKLPSKCTVFGSDLKLYIEEHRQCVYPDGMVVCGDLQLWGKRDDVILNPVLAVEVLSPSTERYDQGTKASYYQSVPSLQHLLLISQERVTLHHHSRAANQTWKTTRYASREDAIKLLGIEIKLEEIYSKIL